MINRMPNKLCSNETCPLVSRCRASVSHYIDPNSRTGLHESKVSIGFYSPRREGHNYHCNFFKSK